MYSWGARMVIPKSDIEGWRTLERRWEEIELPLRAFCDWWSKERAPRLFQERGPRGKPWAANAPATIAAKGHARPLVSAKGTGPGTLAASFRAYVSRRSSRRFEIVQANKKPYARFLSEGRGSRGGGTDWIITPHPPRRFLAFTGAEGEPVFAKSVRHPGYPARPMFGFSRWDYKQLNDRFVRPWMRLRRPGAIFQARGAAGIGG